MNVVGRLGDRAEWRATQDPPPRTGAYTIGHIGPATVDESHLDRTINAGNALSEEGTQGGQIQPLAVRCHEVVPPSAAIPSVSRARRATARREMIHRCVSLGPS